ncbi:hypothetical protein [Pseudomonas sp. FeS53a]|jgi:hypothetical protein|uniref:hypothetical protein n=1 Tax=Pseudomonas sp. FeS53a TaxID=1604022 RepID=UPI00128CF4A5|nr:hypothetical protein [Pseudomonas sp. FeS53a]
MTFRIERELLDRVYRYPRSTGSSWLATFLTGSGGLCVLLLLRPEAEGMYPLAVVILFIGLVVTWFGRKVDPLSTGDPEVLFRKNALHLKVLRDSQPVWEEKILLKEIASVAIYDQSGWFLHRDRGVVVENVEGQQWRIALKLSAKDIEAFGQNLSTSLKALAYPIKSPRRFQP